MCHDDRDLKGKVNGRTRSVFINSSTVNSSVHADLACTDCHEDIDGDDLPHREVFKRVECGNCHDDVMDLYKDCLHGQAKAKGDPLAPICQNCHGKHDILPVTDPNSAVEPMKIPFLCGKCHREGTSVQLQRNIPQDRILENYSLSIHGEGLLSKGLIVSATCVSCHSAHRILPHTDPRSTISRNNIASTCAVCHAEIESVHRKVIRGELWEKQEHILPACVDCHQPHEIRNAYYDYGMADRDCLECHENQNLVATEDGRSLFVNYDEIKSSKHNATACSQCHTEVNVSKHRPCETISSKVDCSSCHAQVGEDYEISVHGKLATRLDENAPTCKECHGTHDTKGRLDPNSPIFAINIPTLCAKCHREGESAAIRNEGSEIDIIQHYQESTHGKGLLKSGLTVTATCTDCHTAHRELPGNNPESSIYPTNISSTCGNCHYGIQEQFARSVHSLTNTETDKKLPVCNDCHSAHTIRRADSEGFKLTIMNQCGRCHQEVANTYFDTYHGKVSQLGYTKTAKCYDCHGAHDILPPINPKSKLSRENVVETCRTCHPSANRQFAGYLTHATHHDPDKYPFLFWTFWGMTGLLVFTFFISWVHTLLWLPRSFEWRKKLKAIHAAEDEINSDLSDKNNVSESSEQGESE
ncbi:MAG: hypothetical protein DRI23_06970 [Candidatus Cloacimonadota bacterium]|nr:MAG: hypothetical protein DRI23_06970 [Candidatus Cloacimonadota bacterium]